MEGILKLLSTFVGGLLILAALLTCVGGKPKPCPSHICLPKEQIVTVEELIAENPERFRTPAR